MNKARKLATVLLLALFLGGNLAAYQLSPLSVSYSPTGSDSIKAYTITNDTDSPIAVQMSAAKRFVNPDGSEYTEDAPQYFSIQPSKMIIKPQSSQIVRVQYRGPKTVTKELSFRLIAEQIAYSRGAQAESEGQTINFLFVYSTAAYVKPSKVIERVSSSVAKEDGNLKITLENTGSVHQLLSSLSITVTSNDNHTYTLTDEDMKGISGINLLTDSTVEVVIPVPEGMETSASFSADVSYDYKYSV